MKQKTMYTEMQPDVRYTRVSDTAYQIAREVIRNEAKNNVHGNAA